MGWNKGFEIMEEQVVGLYNQGVLNKEVLGAIMKPFKDTDIDSGGSRDLQAVDGKSVVDIICFIVEPKRYKEALENFVPDPSEPEYNEDVYDLWGEITKREWNFW